MIIENFKIFEFDFINTKSKVCIQIGTQSLKLILFPIKFQIITKITIAFAALGTSCTLLPKIERKRIIYSKNKNKENMVLVETSKERFTFKCKSQM